MQVSSKHLTLASRVFKAMLQPHFQEGRRLQEVGFLELVLPDDNPYMFRILLDIIHGRSQKVPQAITSEALLEITILVDKYQLQDVTDVFYHNWTVRLNSEIPVHYCKDLVAWTFIFWVFGDAEGFKQSTRIIQQEAGESVTTELPLPSPILGMVLCSYALYCRLKYLIGIS